MSSSYRATTDSLTQLPDRFLKCRVYGHAWDPIPTTLANPAYTALFAYYDVLRCISCGTERYDGVTSMGTVGQRSYSYPHGYPLSFSLARHEARLEYLQRLSQHGTDLKRTPRTARTARTRRSTHNRV